MVIEYMARDALAHGSSGRVLPSQPAMDQGFGSMDGCIAIDVLIILSFNQEVGMFVRFGGH